MIIGYVCQFGRFSTGAAVTVVVVVVIVDRKPIAYPISKRMGEKREKMINTKNQIK